MTLASLPSITATTLLVVPRSIPMILGIVLLLLLLLRERRVRSWVGTSSSPRSRAAQLSRAVDFVRQHNHPDPPVNSWNERRGRSCPGRARWRKSEPQVRKPVDSIAPEA